MSYRNSKSIVCNNFLWLNSTDEQKFTIAKTAQGILDARAKFLNSSLADLYDEITMLPELRKVHRANDRAVVAAYGMVANMGEDAEQSNSNSQKFFCEKFYDST